VVRPRTETLTGREAEIMDVVWRLGEASAEQIREALPEALHDSTVRTLLRVLEAKGYLSHEARGKAFKYRAVIGRRKAQRHVLRSVLSRFFAGSAEDLVLRLIEDQKLTVGQLDELRRAAPGARAPGAGHRRAGSRGRGKQP
jgi:predicted transcriptional regulator